MTECLKLSALLRRGRFASAVSSRNLYGLYYHEYVSFRNINSLAEDFQYSKSFFMIEHFSSIVVTT